MYMCTGVENDVPMSRGGERAARQLKVGRSRRAGARATLGGAGVRQNSDRMRGKVLGRRS